jgi:hypothetical protein
LASIHDLRGTAVTKFYIVGSINTSDRRNPAWTEEQVERMIRRYVARGAATKAAIRQLHSICE